MFSPKKLFPEVIEQSCDVLLINFGKDIVEEIGGDTTKYTCRTTQCKGLKI